MDDKRVFCQFEADENLFERTYNGVPYWQMLRLMVCEGAYSERIEHEDAVKRAGRKKQLYLLARKLPSAYIRSLVQFKRLKKNNVVCLWDIEKKNQSALFFDYWTMPSDVTMLRVNEMVNTDMLDAVDQYSFIEPYCKGHSQYYLKKLWGKLQIDKQEQLFLQGLEEKVRKKFGRSVSAQRMESEILHWIEIDKAHERFFEKFFLKVDCKAIVVVCYYQNQLYSAYRVARKRRIRVIELQHGVISNHEEYWFEDQRGINNEVPDYFLAFGDAHIAWTKMLPRTRAISVGFPYQKQKILEWDKLKTEERTVVVYPQDDPKFEELIDKFAKIACPKGYRIIVKMHPLQAKSPATYYPLLAQNRQLELVTDQSKGIYYWLKLGKHHVMADTTVGLEAVAYDHTNICIATNVSHLQTQPLLDWNVARGFASAEELLELVKHPIKADNMQQREKLWKKNAAENVQMFFKSMNEQNWPESQNYRP